MRAAEGVALTKLLTAFYYISWIFAGNFILLNLFLAILLDSFVQEDEEDDTEELLKAELEAEKRRQELIEREKQRRLKTLGKTTQRMIFQKSKTKPKKKKTRTFTGEMMNEELIADVEELDKGSIREILY